MPVLDGIEATRLLAGAGVPHPVKVLVVTTFNLDEYVYKEPRAGASGFLLKDAPPAQLLQGIRTVGTGAALLNPEVTRQLVGRHAAPTWCCFTAHTLKRNSHCNTPTCGDMVSRRPGQRRISTVGQAFRWCPAERCKP
jgi:DNA-binding NarL/FixJ family response regulator